MTQENRPSSRIAGFHRMAVDERINRVSEFAGLGHDDRQLLANTGNLPAEMADHLIENLVGTMNIPMGIATNMKIDGVDRLIPMATEESSVVAAVCNAARQSYDSGGVASAHSLPIAARLPGEQVHLPIISR